MIPDEVVKAVNDFYPSRSGNWLIWRIKVVCIEPLLCACWMTPNFWEIALLAEKKILTFTPFSNIQEALPYNANMLLVQLFLHTCPFWSLLSIKTFLFFHALLIKPCIRTIPFAAKILQIKAVTFNLSLKNWTTKCCLFILR